MTDKIASTWTELEKKINVAERCSLGLTLDDSDDKHMWSNCQLMSKPSRGDILRENMQETM